MSTRPHTRDFKELRTSRNFSSVIIELEPDDDGGLLPPSGPKEIIKLELPPPWLKKQLDTLHNYLVDIASDLQKLKTMHSELPRFGEATNHSEIEDFTTVLTARFMKTSDTIKSLGNNQDFRTDSWRRFIKNLKTIHAMRLQDLSAQFESSQQKYLSNVMGRTKASNINLSDSSSDEDTFIPSGSSLEPQQQMLREDAREAKARNKQVRHLAKSIQEITVLFKSMAEMVHAQGTLLDRIDNNISSAAVNMEQAVEHLDEAESLTSNNGKCLLIFLVIIIGFTATVLVLIRLKAD